MIIYKVISNLLFKILLYITLVFSGLHIGRILLPDIAVLNWLIFLIPPTRTVIIFIIVLATTINALYILHLTILKKSSINLPISSYYSLLVFTLAFFFAYFTFYSFSFFNHLGILAFIILIPIYWINIVLFMLYYDSRFYK